MPGDDGIDIAGDLNGHVDERQASIDSVEIKALIVAISGEKRRNDLKRMRTIMGVEET